MEDLRRADRTRDRDTRKWTNKRRNATEIFKTGETRDRKETGRQWTGRNAIEYKRKQKGDKMDRDRKGRV